MFVSKIGQFLRFFAFGLLLNLALGGPVTAAWAQETLQEASPDVEGADGGVTYLELFSAEVCPFCPAAERNFNDITMDPDVIGVTCMVDYFDSGESNALSRPFCRDRQDVYVHMLRAGTRYTPQLVINGSVQLPGQNLQNVSAAIRKTRADKSSPVGLEIAPGAVDGSYDILLPDLQNKAARFVLRITMIKYTSDNTGILKTANQYRERTLHNIATTMVEGGVWDGKSTIWTINPPDDAGDDGFIVTVQGQDSGRVFAVGEYSLDQ